MKVSVVIPCYNVEKYLHQCIESVVNQTLRDIEIICVNDGSTDSTLSILREYEAKDGRIKIINKQNGGYGIAMNQGFELACGEYLGIVEPDDYILPDMFATLYEEAKQNDLDFIKSDFYRFTTNPKSGQEELSYFCATNDKKYYNKVFNPQLELQTFRFQMNTWSGIYKKSFIDKHKIRHNQTPGASFQDNGFYFLTWSFATRAMVIPQAFYKNRRDNPSSSVKSTKKVYAMNVEYNYIKKCLEPYPQIWQNVKGYWWLRKFFNYNITLARIDKSYVKEFLKEFKTEVDWAVAKGELDFSVFTKKEKSAIKLLRKNQNLYGYLRRLAQRPACLGTNQKPTQTNKALQETQKKNFESAQRNPIKVSVIISVYNGQKYLGQCLDSVCAQTLKEIEIICINDGSTDNSLKILTEYATKDSRIKIIDVPNSGAGKARNIGMASAKGKYLSFLDCDDFFENTMLEKSFNKLEETEADFAVFHSKQYWENTNSFIPANWTIRDAQIPPYRPLDFRSLNGNVFKVFVGWAWDKVFRSDFVRSHNLYFQEQRTSNDLFFVFSALVFAQNIEVLPDVLAYQRRQVKSSLSNTREKSWDCFYNALIELRNILVKNGLYTSSTLRQDFINYALHFSLWNLNTIKGENQKVLFNKLKDEWFENLEISKENQNFFYNQNEYTSYKLIKKVNFEKWKKSLHTGVAVKFKNKVLNSKKSANPFTKVFLKYAIAFYGLVRGN